MPLRYARHHFDSLRPYRWRLARMVELTKPPYTAEHRAALHALQALDRFAKSLLSPEDFDRFIEPWFPPDQT